MNTWQFYATSDLPILGGTEYDYPAKFNALMAAIQAYFEERQSFLTGCFTAPTLGQSSLQVTITDLLALVGGVGVSGSDFVDFTGKGAGTYTVQVDDAGVVTATLSPSAAQIPLCTQVWTGSAFTGAPTPAFVLLSDILHNRQHSIVSDDDHTFPGGTTNFLREDGAFTTPPSGVTDHGALSGLGDDDHTQYSKADGTRAFSNPVSGATPTQDAHLTTKAYVDGLVNGLNWQEAVLDRDLTAPPGSPTTGDRFIVATGATGAWAGHDLEITEKTASAWAFTALTEGLACWIADENIQVVYNGTAWAQMGGGTSDHGALSGLGDDDHTQYIKADGTRAFTGGITGVTAAFTDTADTPILTLKTAAGAAIENDALVLKNSADTVLARLFNNGTFKGRYLWSVVAGGGGNDNGGGLVLRDTTTTKECYLVQRNASDDDFQIYFSSDGGSTFTGPVLSIDRQLGTLRLCRITDTTPTANLLEFLTAAGATLAFVDKDGIAQFAGLKSSGGNAGASAAQGGMTFENGLYISGSALWFGAALQVVPAAAPPLSPVEGGWYGVLTGASGAWTGHGGDLAHYVSSAFAFTTPAVGTKVSILGGGVYTAVSGSWANDMPASGMSNPMNTLGDVIYGGASGAATRLAGNTTATKKVITQTGDGANSAAPAWGTLLGSDVDINGTAATTDAPDGASDYLLVYDASGTAVKKIKVNDFAKRNQTFFLTGAGGTPSKTGGCTAAAIVEMSTNKQSFNVPAFDKDTEQYIEWGFGLPTNYDGGTVTAKFYWMHPATTTNFGTVWGLQGRAYADDDAGDQTWGTAQTATDVGGTTSDIYITAATSAITLAGSPAGGQFVQFRAYRKAADGSDSLAVSAYLLGVLVTYGVNAY